jgi:hypothetical protein
VNVNYQRALDKKMEWLRWSGSAEARNSYLGISPISAVWPMYEDILAHSDTYFMNDKFCDLVDVARQSVPDDLDWQAEWTPTKRGFMWLEKPFRIPPLGSWAKISKELQDGLTISAVGWFPVTPGVVTSLAFGREKERIAIEHTTELCFFVDFSLYGKYGFNPWSYMTLAPGDLVRDRIKTFEKSAYVSDGAYCGGRETDMLHEIRWVYSAFHLMSQRLAVKVEHQADRHLRRRMEKEGSRNTPTVQYVTLRRYEEARKKAAASGESVEWNCQWMVGGHWRNQWYATEQKHRPVWIEDYIKGPEGKPLRQPSEKIYRAVR